jgi:hypothetical protein
MPRELDLIEAVNFMAQGGVRRQPKSMDGSWKGDVARCSDLITGPQQHNTALQCARESLDEEDAMS